METNSTQRLYHNTLSNLLTKVRSYRGKQRRLFCVDNLRENSSVEDDAACSVAAIKFHVSVGVSSSLLRQNLFGMEY